MSKKFEVELNGSLVLGRIDGLDTLTIELSESDETGVLLRNFSSRITFYDDGYLILKDLLIDNLPDYLNPPKIKIYDTCCGVVAIEGFVGIGDISYAKQGCYISFIIVQDEPKLNCIKSTLLNDNHQGIMQTPVKGLRYCLDDEKLSIQIIITYFGAILQLLFYSIILPLIVSFTVVNALLFVIRSIVCFIPFTDCTQADANNSWVNPGQQIAQVTDLFSGFFDFIVPCGRYHPTALWRDLIINACDKCGLSFKSSILNDVNSPYYNTLYFNAPIGKGYKKEETNYFLKTENVPIDTLEGTFIKYANPIFNGRLKLKENILNFERKDKIFSGEIWITTNYLFNENKIIGDVIFTPINKGLYSYGDYSFSSDFIDTAGDRALSRTNTLAEWNNPYSPSQSGSLKLQVEAGAGRFRDDGLDFDLYTFFQTAVFGIINSIFSNSFSEAENYLLLTRHVAALPKFLIWDTNSNSNYATIKKYYDNNFTGGELGWDVNQRYNYPYSFRKGFANNLYSLFHYIDDPRSETAKVSNFEFLFMFTCDEYKSLSFEKNVEVVMKNGQIKLGEIESISVDLVNRIMKIKGIV